MLWQLCVTALLHSVMIGWDDGALKQYEKRRKCKQGGNKHLIWNIFPSIVFYLRASWRRRRCLTVTGSWVWLHHVTDLFCGVCVGTLASSHSPQTWISIRCKGLPLKPTSRRVVPEIVKAPSEPQSSASRLRGFSLNPKQLEFYFATLGYRSVIVKYTEHDLLSLRNNQSFQIISPYWNTVICLQPVHQSWLFIRRKEERGRSVSCFWNIEWSEQ